MSVLTTLVGGYYTLTVGDKTYRVKSLIDRQLQADFTRWHFEQAVGALSAARRLYSDQEFDRERQKLRAEYNAGVYDFKSARGAETLGTMAGIAFVLSKLIEGVDGSAVLELVAECQADVVTLLQQILNDSFSDAIRLAKKKELLSRPVTAPRVSKHRKK